MNTPTYKEQFDKLTRAYIEGRVNPYSGCACFVGNLLNGKSQWEPIRAANMCIGDGTLKNDRYSIIAIDFINSESNRFYTKEDILNLENNFLKILRCHAMLNIEYRYEQDLFNAFESTLELLKQIHISKGEVIDDVPIFTKRILQPA